MLKYISLVKGTDFCISSHVNLAARSLSFWCGVDCLVTVEEMFVGGTGGIC